MRHEILVDGAEGTAGAGQRTPAAPLLTVVVPTRNEAGNVRALVERIERALGAVAAEIVFVDDSSDETVAEVEAVGATAHHDVSIIHREPERRAGGLGGAVVEGIRAARGEWVCVIDGDLQHPPEVIPRLLDRAKQAAADLVVASRYTEHETVGGFSRVRALISRGGTALAHVLFPVRLHRVTDPLSGFFLVRRTAVDLDRLRPRGFKILLEILGRTPALRIAEVPFEFGERHAGESKASFREGLRYVAQLCELRVGERAWNFGRFGAVGLSGLLVNVVAFALFVRLLGVHYLAAAALATQVSTLWNFALTEAWIFSARSRRRSAAARAGMFFLMNNVALVARAPMLVVLVATLGVNDQLSNVVSLAALTVVRFGVADRWIWSKERPAGSTLHGYDIHGLVTVASEVALPELERFRVHHPIARPTVRVRIGTLSRVQSALVAELAFLVRHTRYDDGLGRYGFGIDITIGKSVQVVASPLLRRSPHVLYTNVVEAILRWTFVKKGFALVHGACISFDDRAVLITAKTDTGKTTTILRTLDSQRCSFLSDDLTLLAPDGRVLTYPKPMTISNHTVRAVNTPLLSRRERFFLPYQSRLHSRSGRRFAFLLAKTRLPIATINAVVQALVPPPKYHVERLVPGVEKADEGRLAALVVIARGGDGNASLEHEEAVDILLSNCEDAYGFPPYPSIAPFLHSGNGRDLRAEERSIVARALEALPATMLRSTTMDWWQRLPGVVNRSVRHESPEETPPILAPAVPFAID
jgi:glycosyltransferase involved in cell wall biosynthesis